MARSAISSTAWRAARSSRSSSRRPLGAQVLEQLRGLDALALGGRGERLEQLLLGRADLLGRDDGREHGLAAQRQLGVRLHLGEDLLLGAPGDLQVGLARDAAVGQRVEHPLPHLLRPRLDQLGRQVDARGGHGGVERGLAELGLDPFLVGLDQTAADVLAQLLHAVEAGVDREVVVDVGQLLELDLLDGHLERRLPPGELLVAVVGGEGQLHRARLAGARADEPLLEARDQVAAAQLDQLVATLAARQLLQRRLPVDPPSPSASDGSEPT